VSYALATRKQISALMVIVLVKKVSIPADVWPFCRKLDDNCGVTMPYRAVTRSKNGGNRPETARNQAAAASS
jgi:hypothetical protein